MTTIARRTAQQSVTPVAPRSTTPAVTMAGVTKPRTTTSRSISTTKTPAKKVAPATASLTKKVVAKKVVAKKAAPAKASLAKKVVAKKAAPAKATPVKKVVAKKAAPAKVSTSTKATTATVLKKSPAPKATLAKNSSTTSIDTPPSRPPLRRTPRAVTPAVATPVVVSRVKPTPVATDPKTPTPLTSDQWNDKNRELFAERIRLAGEIDKLEAILPEERTLRMRQQLKRLRYQHEDITYKIFDANKGLMLRYVRRFTQNASQEDIRDFEAAATVGLMRAITSYDPSRGRFAQWAFKPMQREVLRAVHSADHQNMNPGDFERRPDVLRALRLLQNGDESARPSIEAVAAEANVTVEQAKRVLQAPRLDSIYTPVGDGTSTLGEMLADETDVLEDNVINRMGVMDLQTYGLSELDPRELFVIIRRQGLDCEPKQRLNSIGATLGLSREAVRQIESRARGKLAHPVVLRKLARQGRD